MHEGFTAATIGLDGSPGDFSLSLSPPRGLPLLVHAYLPEDAVLSYMWSAANINKTAEFLDDVPEDVHFLFVSYGCKPLPEPSSSPYHAAAPWARGNLHNVIGASHCFILDSSKLTG